MESSPSPWTNVEEEATPPPPQSIVLDSNPPPSEFLEGTPLLASHQPFEAPPVVEKDTFLKSFFMFTLGLFLPVIVFFLIAFLGEFLDDEAYERHEREIEENEENYPNPYDLTLLRNETGVYSSTIDLPDTHELSECRFDIYGGNQDLYYHPSEYISCRSPNSYQVDNNSGDLEVWQYTSQPDFDWNFTPSIELLAANYSFQSKELSLSFDDVISENLSLDVYSLNEQNQYSKASVSGETLDGKNYIFQSPTNSSDEFYMEMNLNEGNFEYFFSAEACDSCFDETFPYLDQVRFFGRMPSNLVEIGHYDSQSNELSFKPLPMANGEQFPEQIVFNIGIDWAPIALTNNMTWVSTFTELSDFSLSGEMWYHLPVNTIHPNYGTLRGFYPPDSLIEFSPNINGTYERTFKFDQTNSLPLIDCQIDSTLWPDYYDASQTYPIYCEDADSSSGYDAMIYEASTFEIDEHVTIINQSWDPENREFHVEFNRTLIVEENDFLAGQPYGQYNFVNFAYDGPRKNFTVTIDEWSGDNIWGGFRMQFEISGNTSFDADGHSFSWYTWCDLADCEQNLTAPTYSGITTTSEVIGGYNMSNQTLWFHPSQPTPPIVEMQISLIPETSLQTLAQLNYGVYLYGDDYVEYVDDPWDRYGSYPSDDLYFFSLILSPFIYIGAIIYSFMRGNKAFAKGLLSSSIAALASFGAFVVFVIFFLF